MYSFNTINDLQVLKDLPFVAFVKDSDGKYLWVNKGWLEVTGIDSIEKAIGKTDDELLLQSTSAL